MASLTVTLGEQVVKKVELRRSEIVIGRIASADVVLDNVLVSRRHALLRNEAGQWVIEDLSGKNGIFVNRQKTRATTLKDRDIIEIGKFQLTFHQARDEQERDAAQAENRPGAAFKRSYDELLKDGTPATRDFSRNRSDVNMIQETMFLPQQEMQTIREQMDQRRRPHLQAVTPMDRKVFPFTKPTLTLGRSPTCDVRLNGGLFVGKLHAVIEASERQFVLKHTGGFASVKVNGQKVETAVLQNNDEIEIGSNKLRFIGGFTTGTTGRRGQ